MDVALLLCDEKTRETLTRALRALGREPTPIRSPADVAGSAVGAAILDGQPHLVADMRAAMGPAAVLLAVAPEAAAADLLAAGATDIIGPHVSPVLLAARLAPRVAASGEHSEVASPGADNGHAERALREAETFLRTLLESAPVTTIALDREGRFTFSGGAAMGDLGLVPGQALGHSIFERWADLPEVLDHVRRALAGEAHAFEWEFADRTLETSVNPLRDDAGEVAGLIGVSIDTSERKRAERAMQESEAKFRAFAETTTAALLGYRADGRLFYANQALATITGYTFEELTAPGFFRDEVVHPDDRPSLLAASAALMTGQEGQPVTEFRVRCKDGSIRWLRVSGSTFLLDGERAAMVTGFDITQGKEAEEALRTSEAKFRAYAESTYSAVWAFTETGTLYANRAFLELTGYSMAEVLRPGFFLDVVVHPDDRAELAERRRRRLAGEDISPWFEYRIITKSGDTRWVRITSGRFSLNGEPAAVATAFDITDRREAEEALQESRQRYESLVESIEAIVWEANPHDFQTTFVSPQAERLLGYPASRWIDELGFWIEHIHPEDREWVLAAGRENVRALRDYVLEYRVIAADGREVWLRDLVTVDSVGEVAQTLCGVMIDVTEQRHAEAARHTAEEYLRTVLSAAPVILWAVDQDGRLTLVEGRVPADSTNDEYRGQSIFKYADEGRPRTNMLRALAGEAFTDTTETNGVMWETHYSPLRNANGEVTGVIGVSIDVTERRRTETAMLQSQKLESLGVLAGGIAHDFNNLLVAILGNAGIALMEIGPHSPARETIGEIEKAGQRAADLARQMLAYSGKGKFVIDRINLGDLVEEMTHLMRVSIAKGITVTYDLDPALPPIEGDPTQLRQVAMNLVVNAADAVGPGPGTIAVRTGVSEETVASLAEAYLGPELPAGKYVFLEVADTGCGMDETTLSRIFDPFFTTKFTGRGLGLAAVLGIVRGHRGAIHIHSEPGMGTTFRLLLPAIAGSAPEAAAETVSAEAWRGTGVVLVADDEDSVRRVTARALQLLGFETAEAAAGAQAVAIATEREGLVCAILDLTMPGIGGEQAFEQIQRLRPGLPVVILSGYSEQEATARFTSAAQPTAFLQKPYELATLREVMRQTLERA